MVVTTTPKLIATIGLHGSASTWVFNVVRELIIAAFTEDEVAAFYAEKLEDLPAKADPSVRHIVLKSHHGSAALDAWLNERRPQIFVSVRDPRDASISMAQRFRTPLAITVRWLENDCQRLMRLSPTRILLRYEQRFFDHMPTIVDLASALGIEVAPETVEGIFQRYRTDAVRNFARGLTSMDHVTQIHQTHIGDTQSGKWRALPEPTQAELTRRFAPFLDRFGYA